MMMTIEKELDRVLTLLRNKIRERGFTQLDVQESLGWGRSYISQLLTKQKSLRIEQILLILNVIGEDPGEFFSELYHFPAAGGLDGQHRNRFLPAADASDVGSDEGHKLKQVSSLMQGLVRLLTSKGLVEAEELRVAVNAVQSEAGEE